MTYPCANCNMDEGSPVCLQDKRCPSHNSMDATLRAAARCSAKIIRPESDCRTCKGYNMSHKEWCDVCTNADRYQPLPPVRLWRTT